MLRFNTDNNWKFIVRNPNITLEYLENHINEIRENSAIHELQENPNITEEFVEKYINKCEYSPVLVENPNISMGFIEKHPDVDFDYYDYDNIPRSPNFTIEYVKKYIKEYPRTDDSDGFEHRGMTHVSMNPSIKLKDIEENLDLNWRWECIAQNPNITIDFVNKYIKEFGEWAFMPLSQNPGIKMCDIENNPDYEWNWEFIACNININMEFAKKHINEDLDWHKLSSNPGIMITDIVNNPECDWDYSEVFKNHNLTFSFIDDKINNTHQCVTDDWCSIIRNPFTYERKMAYKKKYETLQLPADIITIIQEYVTDDMEEGYYDY